MPSAAYGSALSALKLAAGLTTSDKPARSDSPTGHGKVESISGTIGLCTYFSLLAGALLRVVGIVFRAMIKKEL